MVHKTTFAFYERTTRGDPWSQNLTDLYHIDQVSFTPIGVFFIIKFLLAALFIYSTTFKYISVSYYGGLEFVDYFFIHLDNCFTVSKSGSPDIKIVLIQIV